MERAVPELTLSYYFLLIRALGTKERSRFVASRR